MVKGALWKKAIRDMQKSKAQFISILIMAALAVSIVTGLDSVWISIENHTDTMYRATNRSDLWVTVANPSEQQVWKIQKIPGVALAERRFTADADTDLPGNPTLHIYALDNQNTLDQPDLRAGRFGKQDGGAVLDEAFAKAHGLKIGDSLSVKLNGTWVRLPITGLALSSEHIFSVKNSTDLSPNSQKYGFLTIRADSLESVYGQKVFNQICIKLLPGADVSQVEQQADEIIGKNLIGLIAWKDSSSAGSVDSLVQQFKTLATAFPLLFFLVTALITQSTMMRLVENQRSQIGTLKALGYSRRTILMHYTSYGLGVGFLGALAGLAIGPVLFGKVLIPRLRLTLPDYSVSVNYPNFFFALLLILICTGGVSFYACWKLQGDTPAVLLRDKPPKRGSHILLESVPSLWRKMRFSRKLIARNIFRNKSRLIMSIIGIMGCTGTILSAFTINDMVAAIPIQVYEQTFTYDQKVLVDQKKTDFRYLNNLQLDGITQQIQETAAEVVCPNGQRKMEPLTITTQDSPLVNLRELSGKKVTLTNDGITMTRKLAETLGVKQGDSIRIKRTSDQYVSVPIVQTVYLASGQGIYLTDTYWKSLGEKFQPTALLIKWNGAPDKKFLSSDAVEEAVDRTGQSADFAATTQVMLIAVIMLIVIGAALAFVVLYNCSVLNYTERIRDLATLRVLGFHQKEVRSLVLLENYISSFLGLLLGIPVGWFIAEVVAAGLDKRMDLIGSLSFQNILISGAMTFLFAGFINQVVAKKMQNLDMLSALKSVE
ncbi:ABC transporter permease [Caproiciproducens faecalis]|uniref:FtsX-like permease family protein n=1 Tax=Caproiciproducens faecalis TaxID=2820301 RepID=A0ABS7DLV2_9FIRM|nr:FtsX-like permease family protein [Caproiciproducens faecalis]MBW7572084.1 FtsX-like permease family protein [Caproiciproducens faecalis]